MNKNKTINKMLRRNEFYILLIIIVLCIIIEIRSGQFFTINNLVDLASAMIIPTLFGLGQYIVIISGGFDLSFCTMASLCSYVTVDYFLKLEYTGSLIIPLLFAIGLGVICGSLNGLIIAKFKFPPMIVTLGTQYIFRGIMQGVLGAVQIYSVPQSMKEFGYASLFTVTNEKSGLSSKMPVAILFVIVIAVIITVVMKKTMFGRGIFAVGGSDVAAERAGFPVFKIRYFVYVIAGVIASLAGFIRMSMIAQAQPTNLLGMEMTVIASVVLGGTSILGGRGTVYGAILGTFLIVLVQNSLIMIGIPTIWQGFFLGVLIIIGTAISVRKTGSRRRSTTEDGEVQSIDE